MRRLSTMIRPMSMEWQDIGCSYNTSTGMRTVLKVWFFDDSMVWSCVRVHLLLPVCWLAACKCVDTVHHGSNYVFSATFHTLHEAIAHVDS
jgi:hypothetical protein